MIEDIKVEIMKKELGLNNISIAGNIGTQS